MHKGNIKAWHKNRVTRMYGATAHLSNWSAHTKCIGGGNAHLRKQYGLLDANESRDVMRYDADNPTPSVATPASSRRPHNILNKAKTNVGMSHDAGKPTASLATSYFVLTPTKFPRAKVSLGKTWHTTLENRRPALRCWHKVSNKSQTRLKSACDWALDPDAERREASIT
jgi:hypothetical protein